jgi:hypothetical protein
MVRRRMSGAENPIPPIALKAVASLPSWPEKAKPSTQVMKKVNPAQRGHLMSLRLVT